MKPAFSNGERCIVKGRDEAGVVTKVWIIRAAGMTEYHYEVKVDKPAWKGDRQTRVICGGNWLKEEPK